MSPERETSPVNHSGRRIARDFPDFYYAITSTVAREKLGWQVVIFSPYILRTFQLELPLGASEPSLVLVNRTRELSHLPRLIVSPNKDRLEISIDTGSKLVPMEDEGFGAKIIQGLRRLLYEVNGVTMMGLKQEQNGRWLSGSEFLQLPDQTLAEWAEIRPLGLSPGELQAQLRRLLGGQAAVTGDLKQALVTIGDQRAWLGAPSQIPNTTSWQMQRRGLPEETRMAIELDDTGALDQLVIEDGFHGRVTLGEMADGGYSLRYYNSKLPGKSLLEVALSNDGALVIHSNAGLFRGDFIVGIESGQFKVRSKLAKVEFEAVSGKGIRFSVFPQIESSEARVGHLDLLLFPEDMTRKGLVTAALLNLKKVLGMFNLCYDQPDSA